MSKNQSFTINFYMICVVAQPSFLCLCETFLFDGINDSEIHIPDFTVIRCDRFSREGGGVCIYLKNSISFKTCPKLSNSVCDLLNVSLQTPSLIIILVYRPPSCPVNDFEEISLKINTFVMSLLSPYIILVCLVTLTYLR